MGQQTDDAVFWTLKHFWGGKKQKQRKLWPVFCEPFCAPPVFGDIPVYIGGCNCYRLRSVIYRFFLEKQTMQMYGTVNG